MVYIHPEMHTAIWSWIRGWCEEDFYRAPLVLPETPVDVLEWLIWKIGNCGGDTEGSLHPFVVEGGEEDWRGSNMFKFAEKMCEVGQRLFDEELQEKVDWATMKKILEYYLTDCQQYINSIDELEWTYYDINEFFELGIERDHIQYTITENRMKKKIIWNRYLTSDKIWLWNGYRIVGGTRIWNGRCIPNTPEKWCQMVTQFMLEGNLQGLLDEHIEGQNNEEQPSNTEEDATIELTEQQEKKNKALRKLQETLDGVQEDIGDGLYLEIMNLMKENYVLSS